MGRGGLEKKIDPRKNPFVLYLKYTSSSFYPATKATVPAPVTEMWTTLFSSYYLQMLEHWNTVGLQNVRPGWKTLYFHEKLKSESWKCIRKKWQTQYVVTLGWSRDLSRFGGETQFRETFICGALSGESPFPRNGPVVVTEQVIDSPMMESRLSWGTGRRWLWPVLKSSLGDWSHHEVFSGASSCLAQVRSFQIVNSKLMVMMIVQENCGSNIWQKGAVQIDQIYLFPFGVGSLCRRFYSREEKWFWNKNPQILCWYALLWILNLESICQWVLLDFWHNFWKPYGMFADLKEEKSIWEELFMSVNICKYSSSLAQ